MYSIKMNVIDLDEDEFWSAVITEGDAYTKVEVNQDVKDFLKEVAELVLDTHIKKIVITKREIFDV